MTMTALSNAAHVACRAWDLTGRIVMAVVVGVPDTLYTWQQRHRMRRELLGLDDRLLRDMGLNRCDAEREGRRPFWKA